MTRGRSNKPWEVGQRKNYKSCKHYPFIQCYLNLEDLGLSKVSVRNFKQYLKPRIRLFGVFLTVSYLTQRIVLTYIEESLHANSRMWRERSYGHSPTPLPPATETQPSQEKEYICLTADSDIIFCGNSHHQEHWNQELVLLQDILHRHLFCNCLYFERANVNLAKMRRNTVNRMQIARSTSNVSLFFSLSPKGKG